MTKKNVKIICGISIIVFVILKTLGVDFLDALSYAVSIAAVTGYCYDRLLWRFNIFDKTPRLHGVYDALFISNYNRCTIHPSVVNIKQTLSSISIYEEAKEGYSVAVTADLVRDGPESNPWHLYYTYLTYPSPNDHDDAHHGTAILCVKSSLLIEGSYYTNRIGQTKGKLILIRRKNPKIACPIDPVKYQ